MVQAKKTKKNKVPAKSREYKEYEPVRENPKINWGGFFLGVVIILVGLAILLYNLGLIKIGFNVWNLWPLILVLIGLSMLDRKSIVSTFVGILAILATIFIVSLAFLGPQYYVEILMPKPKIQNTVVSSVVKTQTTKVQLFYYNRKLDTDITCGKDFVLPVEREIVVTGTPIQDTINLLIQGNLTEEEKAQGFRTEFPNPDFKLLGANLVNGTLTLNFTEVSEFTTGGACRIRILRNEIIKTAEQFQGVEKVDFQPEELFQP